MWSRLTRNIWLKLSALALALLTWFTVRNSIETTEDFVFEVKPDLPTDIVATDISPRVFTVTAFGPAGTIKTVREFKHDHVIDLKNVHGQRTIELSITPKDITGLPGLQIKRISPDKVTIDLDVVIRKNLEVEADVVGAPAPGYTVTGKSVRPSRVFLEMPKQTADKLTEVKTAPVNIEGAKSTVVVRVPLIDPVTPSKTLESYDVQVSVEIRPEIVEKKLEDIPVFIMRSPDDKRTVTLDKKKIAVTVRGRADIMETLDVSAIQVYVDITGQSDGTYNLQPSVKPIEGIISITPELVSYTIGS